MLALALTGCGVGGGQGADREDADAAEGEVTGEIVFQTWNLRSGYGDYFNQVIDDFEEENPGVTVDWRDQPAEGYEESLSTDAAAGTLPDVINVDPPSAYTLASAGQLLDLSETTPEAEEEYLSDAWSGLTFEALGGGTYGYPWYLNTGPTFFNSGLLEEGGLDPDDLPSTYDELFDQAMTMGENTDGATMIGRLPAIEEMDSYGVDVMNDDETEFTFNNAEGVEMIQQYKDLYEAGALNDSAVNAVQSEEEEAFQSGRTAMLPGSSHTLTMLRDNAPDVHENAVMTERITNTSPTMFMHGIGVSAESENTPAAIAFAEFVTNQQNQMDFAKESSVFPSTVDSLEDPYFQDDEGTDEGRVKVESAAQVENAVVSTPPAFPDSSKTYLHEQIAQAVMGDKPIQDALDDAVDYANERMGETE